MAYSLTRLLYETRVLVDYSGLISPLLHHRLKADGTNVDTSNTGTSMFWVTIHTMAISADARSMRGNLPQWSGCLLRSLSCATTYCHLDLSVGH